MIKNYHYFLKRQLFNFSFFSFFFCFSYVTVSAQTSITLTPLADALVRNGSYANTNYGKDTSLVVKTSTGSGYSRSSYLKFSLSSADNISSAKLRIYGRNTDNTGSVNISSFGVNNDSWTESGITWNNAPAASTVVLSSVGVNDQGAYYEFDVTDYTKTQFSGDKVVSFVIKDAATQNKNVAFNSKENLQNQPELIVTPSQNQTLAPLADALVRNGSYANTNYGKDTSLVVKSSTGSGYSRSSYLKFSLSSADNISSAKLRIYGRNTDNTGSVNVSSFGVDSDSWTESGITWNNAPAASTAVLSSVGVNDQGAYYEFDVTNYTKTQLAGDKVVSFLIKDAATQNKNLAFNSKENLQNQPELVISASSVAKDTIPPVVNILFNDSSVSSGSYTNQVKIVINSSDQGGSGLASTEYSLNGATFKTYDSSFTINTPGSYTIKAKATDISGNVVITNAVAFSIVSPSDNQSLTPIADASVRNGSYASINYGSDTSLIVKGSASSGYTRVSYFKFSLNGVTKPGSAKIRIYGRNTDNTAGINISAFGVANDSWTESEINWNNAPAASTAALASVSVTDQAKYYELDVTDYVKAELAGDKTVSFLLKDISNQNKNLAFNSKENKSYSPQLIISDDTDTVIAQSNALLYVENPDKFPSNDYFVFSKVQVPWSRDDVHYNNNHDSIAVRVYNKGVNTLVIKDLVLSNGSAWRIEKLKGAAYTPGTGLPISIGSGTYADVLVRFIAVDQATRVKVLHDTLTIVSNDDNFPSKAVYLNGIWQKQGEGSNEPYSKELLNAFGFKTSTGFGHTDPDKGDSTKLKGDEIKPSYFVRADTANPVSVRQMSAYHGCCTQTESFMWYTKGTSTLHTLFVHSGKDAQSVLPRKNSSTSAAQGTFSPTEPFGFKTGSKDYSDATKNPSGKIGIRVWKVLDAKSNIIPNTYIVANDYLGTEFTNYDYNDNMYYVQNVKPANGTAFFSALKAAPSDLDFGENVLQSTSSRTLNLASLGQIYSDSSKDPVITISSVSIVGESKSEFSASMPAKTTLNPQENTTLTVSFKPTSQGLKIADLLIYYKNAPAPLRVPLYGIAKASGVTVTANYRINSGSSTPITINGKTWSADNQYAFDNLEPYTNAQVKEIEGTDEDSLYFKEQSSNADKKPFRYELPVANGDYVVRLHFAELYWGAPGSGLTGGAGSRVMDVSLENQLRLINFDVTQEVGGATALVKNLPVTVTDGKLNINFSATANRPMVVAVEVYSFRASAARPALSYNQNATGFENNLKKASVYPNPVEKVLHIQFPGTYAGSTNLQIADVTGRVYQIGKTDLQGGISNTVEVNISNLSLKPGFYYLRILSPARPAEVVKLIVK